jgi:hypothetical protein
MIEDEATDIKDFFRIAAMWQSIPTEGPGGEADLKFRYIKTKQDDYEYYSVICPSSGKEFKFGQVKKDTTRLFPKGWQPIFGGGLPDEEEHQPDQMPAGNGNPAKNVVQLPTIDEIRKANGAAPKAPSAEKPVSSTDFWTLQRRAQVNPATANDIVAECTVDRVTDWSRAFHMLRQEIGG